MSGDLKHPSKGRSFLKVRVHGCRVFWLTVFLLLAIPKGTLSGLALTFIAYTLVVFAMAATVTRDSLYNDVNIVQDVSVIL